MPNWSRKFERIKSKDRICSGTGLGLAVSEKLSELLKGGINLESEIGEGSKFTVYTKFTPYCSVATWYLCRSIDDEPIQY